MAESLGEPRNDLPAPLGQQSLADRFAMGYSQRVALRTAIAAIPWFGSAIDVLISGRGTELTFQRLSYLLEELKGLARSIEDEKVDRAFLETEEFYDLVGRAFDTASRTRDREKIRWCAAILVGRASTDQPADLDAEALLNALAELSPRQIQILRAIRRRASGSFRAADLPEFGSDIRFDLKRIEAAGFISEAVGAIYGYAGGAYDVTRAFDQMMRLVEATPDP